MNLLKSILTLNNFFRKKIFLNLIITIEIVTLCASWYYDWKIHEKLILMATSNFWSSCVKSVEIFLKSLYTQIGVETPIWSTGGHNPIWSTGVKDRMRPETRLLGFGTNRRRISRWAFFILTSDSSNVVSTLKCLFKR